MPEEKNKEKIPKEIEQIEEAKDVCPNCKSKNVNIIKQYQEKNNTFVFVCQCPICFHEFALIYMLYGIVNIKQGVKILDTKKIEVVSH